MFPWHDNAITLAYNALFMIIKPLLTSALLLLTIANATAQEPIQAPPPPGATIYNAPPPVLSSFTKVAAIAPIQFTENGVGLALSYEQAIDKEDIVSFILPVFLTFNLAHDQKYGNSQDGMFYFMPGIKFYPTGGFGKIKYAIGPSLVVGAGTKTDQVYGTPTPEFQTRNNFLLGIMVNNSINFNATPHFYLGIDFGLGFTYIHKLAGENQGIGGLVEGGLKLGYRF